MREKIEVRKDYDKLRNDPIELIKAIKEYAMAYQDTKYPVATILESMEAYINIKQLNEENLLDYLKRYRIARVRTHVPTPGLAAS